MLGCNSLVSISSGPLKDTFLLYKRVAEQYRNPDILKIIRSLIPENIVSRTKEDNSNIVSLLKWFKDYFMRWTSKDPVCEMCINAHNYKRDGPCGVSNSNATTAPMQAQIIMGNTWKMRKVEIFHCNSCSFEYAFPRYGEILKIAETKTGRCSEWSMLFGAMLSSLEIKTRIVHDFLDHCWNEAILMPNGKWVHVDSTLDYPISLDHPYYYEEHWGKQYQYVLAFSADKIEDVTQRYTLQWDIVQRRRNVNTKNTIDFTEIYSKM